VGERLQESEWEEDVQEAGENEREVMLLLASLRGLHGLALALLLAS